MSKLILAALLAAFLRGPRPATASTPSAPPAKAQAPAAGAAAQRFPGYVIDARLDPSTGSLTGNEVLEFPNDTGQPLLNFPFHLYLNAYRPQSSFSQELRQDGKAAAHRATGGSIEIAAISAEGYGDLLPTLRYAPLDDGNPADRTVMEVTLPRPLLSGDTVRFHIAFRDRLPLGGEAGGSPQKVIFGAHWQPALGLFRHGEWICHQHLRSGDEFSGFATYDVNLTLPAAYTVGSSGVETGERLGAGGAKTLRFHGAQLRDFAWVAAPDFQVREELFPNRFGAVRLRVMARQGNAAGQLRLLSILRQAMQKFDEWYGPYPYGQITLIDPGPGILDGAESFPMLLAVHAPWWTPAWDHAEPEAEVVHQIGLQYWRDLAAPNGAEEPWLTEGLASYSESRVMASLFGESTSMLNAATIHSGDAEMLRVASIGMPGYGPLARRLWRLAGGSESSVGGKTSAALSMLSALIGEGEMRHVLHDYFARYEFGHPNGANFLGAVEEVSGRRDLEAYFAQVISGAGVLDYAVDSLTSIPKDPARGAAGGYHTSVLLHRVGDFSFPVMVEVGFSDGGRRWATWDGAGQWRRFSWDRPTKAVYARTDPLHAVTMDADFFNNSYVTEPHPLARLKLTNYWAAAQQLLAQWISFLV